MRKCSSTDGQRFATLSQLGTDWGKGDGVRTNFELPEGSLCGGLLGRIAIHKLTENGAATSTVPRGVSVMDRLLDDPARSPPPGVPAIDSDKLACAFVAHLSRYATGAEIARIIWGPSGVSPRIYLWGQS